MSIYFFRKGIYSRTYNKAQGSAECYLVNQLVVAYPVDNNKHG